MHKSILLILLTSISLLSHGQISPSALSQNAAFEKNLGQWDDEVDYKLKLKGGALFYSAQGYTARIVNPEHWESGMSHAHSHEDNSTPLVPFDQMEQLAYKVHYIGSNPDAKQKGEFPFHHYTNYFIGKDTSKWTANVPLYGMLTYEQFYTNIDYRLYSQEDHFKYDFIVHPGGNPNQIQWKVEGTEMQIQNGELHYSASFGDIVEWKPVAYQIINQERIDIDAEFALTKDGIASFQIGVYNKAFPLVIDPVVVFATFSGSSADNWGFTATYGPNGISYGAGITFDIGYPTTTGAYDRTFANGPLSNGTYTDITISCYSNDGSTLLYATYLGGSECDQPHSMIVNSLGQLVVFGVTGSANFPTSSNAADASFGGGPITYPEKQNSASSYYFRFPFGTDAFVSILSPNGNSLIGSTFIGGSGRDGINTTIQKNYGDASRGEVVVDANDNIYITTSTQSSDYPLINTTVSSSFGGCDAGITKLNSNASNFVWSTLYGGANDDQGYGIKVAQNGDVFVTGGTTSSNLIGTTNGVSPSYRGSTDGYICRLSSSGSVLGATYLGTASYDQSFLIDIDKNNAVYVFGQTLGNYPITPGCWNYGNSRLFIHKFNNALTQSIFSTHFGSTSGAMSLVPTAFNVDDCLNIMLSGWGGDVNVDVGFLGGNTQGLPITTDAAQANTDGSDFYFLILKYNASALSYATYFGGNRDEHVDGGTSRFSPDGQIYQAVCAGCGGSSNFPVTPGAYSTTNGSGNCNLGNIKFDFEVIIEADAGIDYDADVDTVCNTLNVQFTNTSLNATNYIWDFGNGQTSTLPEPSTSYANFGNYTVTLVALDTLCDISDTAFLTITHTQGIEPTAAFDADYSYCDLSRTVNITNKSTRANKFTWFWGNGNITTGQNPIYSYPLQGTYTIRLIAEDTLCSKSDTTEMTISFESNIPPPIVTIYPSDCKNGKIDVTYENDSSYYQYRWEWADGNVEYAKYPNSKVPYSGLQEIRLTIIDPECHQTFDYSFMVEITRIDNRVMIPNAFTPNGDLVNDVLELKGNTCLQNTRFTIYNRWGQIVFTTDQPFTEFWKGNFNDGNIKEDTYTYLFISEDGTKQGYVSVIP